MVTRFASRLEFVGETHNDEHLIDFGALDSLPAVADTGSGLNSGELLH
ncbi:hypothetical protein [Paraburkholderia sp. MM5496-R1]